MYIQFQKTMPNGAVANCHRFKSLTATEDAVQVVVNSHTSAEYTLIAWQDSYTIPISVLSAGTFPTNIYNHLVSTDGDFAGGGLVDEA